MSDLVQVTIIVTLFRTALIFVGLSFAYLGYKLFCAGVYEHAGDLRAAWGESNLILKQAAPGTLFALFGVAVIGISMFRGTSAQVGSIPDSSPEANEILVNSENQLHESPLNSEVDPRSFSSTVRKALAVPELSGGSLAMSPDGIKVATGHSDGSIRLYGISDGELIDKYEIHKSGVNCLAFSPDARYVISGSDDGNACIWAVVDGKVQRILQSHNGAVIGVTVSPDGKHAFTRSRDGNLRQWDLSSGELLRTIPLSE